MGYMIYKDINKAEVIMISEQYTYNDIKKPVKRKEILSNALSSIGTQSGGFGEFNEQARVLTKAGAIMILAELSALPMPATVIIKKCPTLKALVAYCGGLDEEDQLDGDSHKQQDLLKG